MRIFEHEEFPQAILRAAAHFELSEQFVEKDYYVTEILRIVAVQLGERAMFKGGTSLSKGWGLITRFSEDIDLFVNPDRFDPRPGKNKLDRILKELSSEIEKHPALTWLRDEGQTISGLGRSDLYAYESHFDALPGIRAAVRFEPGIQSGTFPSEEVPITSLVGQCLAEQGAGPLADAEDLPGFEMSLLHYRRTFVEKMFALHGKVVRLRDEDHPLDRDARHYSDLHVLGGELEVRAMLASPEYRLIREDYDRNSREFFASSYRPPENLSFAESIALFPEEPPRSRIEAEYQEQCRLLFATADYPSFDEVLAGFLELRRLL